MLDVHAHQRAVWPLIAWSSQVEELLAIAGPERPCSTAGRHLPAPSVHIREWPHVDLELSRFVRLIREPPTVRRNLPVHLGERSLHQRTDLSIIPQRKDLQVRILLEYDPRTVPRDRRQEGVCCRCRQSLGGAGAICCLPKNTGRPPFSRAED